AIAKGDNDLYTNNVMDINTDVNLAGTPRLEGAVIDLGAYEYSSILPVKVSSFTARLINNRTQLKWNVGTEDNVNRYEVERSQDGVDFMEVATVNASGSSSYMAVDANPQTGINCYRL